MKHHFRKEMKAALATMTPQEVADRSVHACQRIMDLPEFQQAQKVMLYIPMPSEVDTTAVACAAWQAGKTVLDPMVDWDIEEMIAVRCNSFDHDIVRGPYGLREPAGSVPFPPEEIDFIVVPALAYDRTGRRLGRGGGFYDRFLAHSKLTAVPCGLAFGVQVIEHVPAAAHDRPVKLLVTDAETLRF